MRSGFIRHPLSELWGDMPDEQLLELAEDIKKNGILEPVVLFEGEVLDGWHRCQGGQIAQVDVPTINFVGDPVGFVIAKNAHRRHLTTSQKASAIVAAVSWQPSGVQQANSRVEPGATLTNKEMAERADVSIRTITDAKTAARGGMGDAVIAGDISAKEAAKQVRENEHGGAPRGAAQSDLVERPVAATPQEKAKAELEDLKVHLADRDKKIRELTDHLQSYLDVAGADDEQQIKFAQLREQIRVLESQLNEHMSIANQFKRECHLLRKRLGES